jgi:hypothetical protein
MDSPSTRQRKGNEVKKHKDILFAVAFYAGLGLVCLWFKSYVEPYRPPSDGNWNVITDATGTIIHRFPNLKNGTLDPASERDIQNFYRTNLTHPAKGAKDSNE